MYLIITNKINFLNKCNNLSTTKHAVIQISLKTQYILLKPRVTPSKNKQHILVQIEHLKISNTSMH